MAAEVHVLKLPKERWIAAAAARAEAIQPDIEGAIAVERDRVLTLVSIAEQAVAIGVEVNLAAVISDGATPNELREFVMGIAASERDQENG
ncbi:hypothetical protein B5K08_21825 [Rhizobium leguminosarum bv. trifolii]|uniref:Uncharacterized protein n=1 Tax=Rhizobium leguminosarum bv. trifolii TaxID=386 RepID=A0A3E1B8Z2_RHILT|nr:hypothetical protein [Rhizobium leguminosarum]RFB87920.1 hypothetical protein B5K08_21825 [Rhizobium leguminosarum bv. trifolii]RFB88161.1 hypothetical protein B5K10_21820 [Rhizobium leguminosarum bv. trifolii]